jgi:hypothetical protein
MLATLLTFLLISFPSATKTAWMDPASFHLQLGMPQSQVVAQLKADGWSCSPGNEPHHLVVRYDDGRTITLVFREDKLDSARFELVGFIPGVREAFAELEKFLTEKRGEPGRRVRNPTLLSWEDKSPHIVVVLSTSRETSYGRQGLGLLVVRYFVPTK